MKRIRVILAWLLLGAMVNVAVAWGIALKGDLTNPIVGWSSSFESGVATSQNGDRWTMTRHDSPGKIVLHHGSRLLETTPTYSGFQALDVGPPLFSCVRSAADLTDLEGEIVEVAMGWPWPSLAEEEIGPGYATAWRSCFTLTVRGDVKYLPLRPAYFGMLLGSVFYGVVAWLNAYMLINTVRFWRRRRGLCTACKYDLRHADHAACPECGAEVRRAKPA